MSDNVILTMRGISKEFPGVKALSNVDFTLVLGKDFDGRWVSSVR